MKYFLSIGLVLCFSIAAAQLSVRNDAFVFVQDQVLFVNDDVNLQDPASKLYLREEAQLVQGTGTTGNSGVGELSVYQNSEVNQFAYHYWCSPVGKTDSNTINNPFNISQIDDPLFITANPIDSGNSDFTDGYDGIPNMTNTTPSLTISRRWLYTFVTSNQYSQWDPVTENSNIAAGLGFTMKGMGAFGATVNQIFDFRGKPNSGTIDNPILAGQLTLIGNPYPSAIDAADFLWDSDNVILNDQESPLVPLITGAIYYWEQDPGSASHILADYVGGYASYTCTQPDGTDNVNESFVKAIYSGYFSDGLPAGGAPIEGTRVANRYIPIGQGFMVEGAAVIPDDSRVYLKNSHRAYVKESAPNSTFFRNASQTNKENVSHYDENGNFQVSDDYKRFRIVVSFNQLYSRELLANFHQSATAGFDFGLEAKSPSSLQSDAYWTQNDEAFVIQAHNFDENLRIPLVIDIENQQPLSFRIFDIQNFEESQGIYIHDLENDTYVNLRNQNYELNIAPGHYTERFEIVFTAESALSIADLEAQMLSINQNNSTNILVVTNPKNLDLNSIEVYDISGKRLLDQNYKTISNRYELSTSDLSDGVYIVNVLSKSNSKIKSKKIIVKN